MMCRAVRVRNGFEGDEFRALNGEDTMAVHGMLLVRTPTMLPILDDMWFLDQIEACERKWAATRQAIVDGAMLQSARV
jgi:hypothetical protein